MQPNVVCLFCDEGYLPIAWILCVQLAAEQQRNFDIVLFVDSDASASIALPDHPGFEVRFVRMDDLVPADAPTLPNISRAAYYRLLMGRLLNERYVRALYLD